MNIRYSMSDNPTITVSETAWYYSGDALWLWGVLWAPIRALNGDGSL